MDRVDFMDDLTVGRIGRHCARINGAKVALDDGTDRLTYTDLCDQVDALSAAFVEMGIRKNDIVSAYLPNCIEYVVTVLAVARAGGIFSPLNPRFKTAELAAILRQAKPKAVVADGMRMPALAEALGMVHHGCHVVCCGQGEMQPNAYPWNELISGATRCAVPVAETDFFSLLFTSGTTGQPKGALATHRARMIWVLNACILYSLKDDDAYVGTMPLVHSAGLTFTLMHLYVGGTVHILRDFSSAAYIDLLERRRITSSLVVPTMLVMTLDELQRHNRAPDFSALKRLVTCGSPLQESTKDEVLNRITPHLYDYYGSTESNSMTVLKPADQRRKARSVGQPFTNVEIQIVGENGQVRPTGEDGEVWCRNPSLMTRYLDNDQATKDAITDGWYHTGDLGHVDEDGFLYLVARKGDTIISGGFNIYPVEIENVLMNHPDILDCAVIGHPHPKWGECVAAYVVPREGRQIDIDDIQTHCVKHLADYKKPRVLKIVSSIPKNAGGKTVKSQLAKAG